MAASTTWRITGIFTDGGDLELSELNLYNKTTTVDTGAVVTCSHAPIAGAIANLTDGDPLTTCKWAAKDAQAPGFFIQWTLPAPQEPWCARFSAPAMAGFIRNYMLGYRSGEVWSWAEQGRVKWPGQGVLSAPREKLSVFGTPLGWQPITGPVPGQYGYYACAMSADGEVQVTAAYGNSDDKISISKDSGTTWAALTLTGGSIGFGGCAVSPEGDVLIVCGRGNSGAKTHISRDRGDTWTEITGLTAGSDGLRTAGIAAGGQKIFLVSAGSEAPVYRSDNGGTSWEAVPGVVAGTRGYSGCSMSHDGQVIVLAPFGSSSAVLQVSKDGGTTWVQRTGATPGSFGFGFCKVSADGNTIITTGVGSSSGVISFSKDAGATWQYAPVPGVSGGFEHCATTANGLEMAAVARDSVGGTGSYVARSRDRGTTWQQDTTPTPGSTGFVSCAMGAQTGDLLLVASGNSAAGTFQFRQTDLSYEKDIPRTASKEAVEAVRGLHPGSQEAAFLKASTRQVRDTEFGGAFKVYGTVARKNTPTNVPLRRRVRLHRSRDGMLVRETWSANDGTYEFQNISGQYEYDVIAWDHEMSFRSVVANNLTPEAM